ncbi:RdRP-domain-containing protein [Calocera viscosa TUFC12733]|uniref:RNA-dependent RNA polymerase n=1 Tax=Calocera viscosa (strain TUFC12733) TaxID=1330018 RepID=A0A167Q549_CALVF|nr:RdRP-domain-containing protein [Calocera viscosa TUFC12733]
MQKQDPRYHVGKGRLTIGNKDLARHFLELYGTPSERDAWRSRGRGRDGVRGRNGDSRAPSRQSTSSSSEEPPSIVHLAGQTLRFAKFSDRPFPRRVEELNTLPFVDPKAEYDEKQLEKDIGDPVPFHKLQFGRRTRNPDGRFTNTFSIEWEVLLSSEETPEVMFDVPQREVEVRFRKMRYPDSIHYAVVIPWPRVLSMLWDDGATSGEYSAMFHLEVAPSFERLPETRDGRGTRLKLNFLSFHDDCSHEPLAPYISTTMRIVFNDRPSLVQFRDAAKRAFGFAVKPRWTAIAGERLRLFERIEEVERWMETLDLRVALQCSALYSNGYLNPSEVLSLRTDIDKLVDLEQYRDKPQTLANLLSLFADRLERSQYAAMSMRSTAEVNPAPLHTLLQDVAATASAETKQRPGKSTMIPACAAIVTPTSVHLEGPYMDQSNSVLRMYPDHQHYFLRLKFANEDHLPLFNDRDVDSRLFVRYRVGVTLREGLMIGGRHFEFLAYSLSALRQHSVWMVTPFEHPTRGLVTAETIRDSLGDFSQVWNCPARYGARLAQAFTATEPSIVLTHDNIIEVADKTHKGSGAVFTDGVGCMSLEVLEEVWNNLIENRPHYRAKMDFPATVFQFRLGGFKGLLSLNPLIPGMKVHVRPSMNKFDAPNSLGLEIAKSFERPRPFFLNRPFVMLLESRGIPCDVFLTLQRNAVKDIEAATSSLLSASSMAETYGLGGTFRIKYILRDIHDALGLDLQHMDGCTAFSDSFLDHILEVGKANALREIRFRARIPVPNSWTLIGIADEFNILKRNEIYACVHKPGDPEPHWITGPALVTKSPSLGPGDAQFVTAIGKPPPDSPFLLEQFPLKNCVVFSCRGVRPLPSMLGGGDLDGDEFNIVQYEPLFPESPADPDDFTPADKKELDRPCTIDDVVDFIVDYINNDLVGRLATEHLILADQHPDGVNYSNCHQLAQLYALSLDFMKTGTPINHEDIPKMLNDMKPDYLQREQQAGNKSTKFYPSQRALGHMFREPELQVDFDEAKKEKEQLLEHANGSTEDILHAAVRALVSKFVDLSQTAPPKEELLNRYSEELRHISLTTSSGPRTDEATEGEAVMGVILSKTSHPKIRLDRVHRLRLQMTDLVNSVRDVFRGREGDSLEEQLGRAWQGWAYARAQGSSFGARSFALIALGSIFEFVEELSPTSRRSGELSPDVHESVC